MVELDETTVAQLHARLLTSRLLGVSLAKTHLARIEAIDRRGPALDVRGDLVLGDTVVVVATEMRLTCPVRRESPPTALAVRTPRAGGP